MGTNIVPRQMTREQLVQGVYRLCQKLYEADAFGERVLRFIDRLAIPPNAGTALPNGSAQNLRQVEKDSLNLLSSMASLGPREAAMQSKIVAKVAQKPEVKTHILAIMVQYIQIRTMMDRGQLWEPHISEGASAPTSPFGTVESTGPRTEAPQPIGG